jgi:hypothetical protein
MNRYLVTYHPLIGSPSGRKAILRHNLPPYVDASCRREPDLQSQYPSISALCRKGKFAPRLKKGDIAVYLTCEGKYPGAKEDHWRLTAILEVCECCPSHLDAAQWYRRRQIGLPTNCMVPGNPPLPLDKTERYSEVSISFPFHACSPERLLPVLDSTLLKWDQGYQDRATACGIFLICNPLFRELYDPPIVTRDALMKIFQKIPGTRNPGDISEEKFRQLKTFCGLV